MDRTPKFTQDELLTIYTACMDYGHKLTEIVDSIPNEGRTVLNELTDKAEASRKLARKVSFYMEVTRDV